VLKKHEKRHSEARGDVAISLAFNIRDCHAVARNDENRTFSTGPFAGMRLMSLQQERRDSTLPNLSTAVLSFYIERYAETVNVIQAWSRVVIEREPEIQSWSEGSEIDVTGESHLMHSALAEIEIAFGDQ
jgi:hypothetical protein